MLFNHYFSVYDVQIMHASFNLITRWFTLMEQQGMSFPSNFDFSFYLKGIQAALDLTDHSMVLARVFWHLYQTLTFLPRDLRRILVSSCFLTTP